MTARYGITNRLEAEGKIPYVYRDDRISFIIPQVDPDAQLTQEVDGDWLGDIELGLHYQVNDGLEDWPTFIANLRYKSPSGKGPFDVHSDANGLESELATRSRVPRLKPAVAIPHTPTKRRG